MNRQKGESLSQVNVCILGSGTTVLCAALGLGLCVVGMFLDWIPAPRIGTQYTFEDLAYPMALLSGMVSAVIASGAVFMVRTASSKIGAVLIPLFAAILGAGLGWVFSFVFFNLVWVT